MKIRIPTFRVKWFNADKYGLGLLAYVSTDPLRWGLVTGVSLREFEYPHDDIPYIPWPNQVDHNV